MTASNPQPRRLLQAIVFATMRPPVLRIEEFAGTAEYGSGIQDYLKPIGVFMSAIPMPLKTSALFCP
jgi:hypothetical protein